MLFSKPPPDLPKVTSPKAAPVCEKSKPSPEGKALLKPDMTPPQYLHSLKENKMSVDSVHFLAHGLPPPDAICWAVQACRLVAPKLSPIELDALKLTEAWLKLPAPNLMASISVAVPKCDFTGPAGWAGQAALWIAIPSLVAAAVAGAILLAAGLKVGVAMPPIPQLKIPLPMVPLTPEFLLKLPKLPPPPPIPVLDQPKLMKLLLPFIELGIAVAMGKVRCC